MPFGFKKLPFTRPQVAPPKPPAPAAPMGTFGVPQINTSITPTGIYSPEQTQHAVNQGRASLSREGSMRTQMHAFDRPGVSRSAGVLRHVIPKVADIRAQSGYLSQAIPFGDAYANARNMLSGQQARSGEFMGLAGLANSTNQANISANQQRYDDLLRMLLGGFGQFI